MNCGGHQVSNAVYHQALQQVMLTMSTHNLIQGASEQGQTLQNGIIFDDEKCQCKVAVLRPLD